MHGVYGHITHYSFSTLCLVGYGSEQFTALYVCMVRRYIFIPYVCTEQIVSRAPPAGARFGWTLRTGTLFGATAPLVVPRKSWMARHGCVSWHGHHVDGTPRLSPRYGDSLRVSLSFMVYLLYVYGFAFMPAEGYGFSRYCVWAVCNGNRL